MLRGLKLRSLKLKIRGFHSKLQYISDIHLEYRNDNVRIPQYGKHLALLGDIGNPYKDNYFNFLKYVSQKWETVLLLSGNHEYWNEKYDYDRIDNKISELTEYFGNVHYLNNTSYQLENYNVLGTTLWSHIMKQPDTIMGDDLNIRDNGELITITHLNKLHETAVDWLTNEINKSEKPIIVLTHHLPSYQMIHQNFYGNKYEKYHDRFASHLDYLIRKPVKYWLCGHSHIVLEKEINGIICGINAYGYPRHSNIKKDDEIIRYVTLQ